MSIIYLYMRNYLSSLKKNAGFTLIELLVVIGILGILAAALIATIDPFEQLKKATDANIKNALVEYLNANVRYYTTHDTFPWDTVINGGAACNAAVDPPGNVALNAGNMPSCTTALVNDKELKSAYGNATDLLKEIYITGSLTNKTVRGCFKPSSQSQQKNKETKYTDSAGTIIGGVGTCKSTVGGTTDCYWCTE
jgi:prepilin-type N-terminal cleavage/methylation domain-containing protein